MTLHVSSFGVGVVLLGAPDTRAPGELLQADGYDIGLRGSLVCTSDASDYIGLADAKGLPLEALLGLFNSSTYAGLNTVAVAQGRNAAGATAYLLDQFPRSGAPSPKALTLAQCTAPAAGGLVGSPVPVVAAGAYATSVVVAGVYPMKVALVLLNPSNYSIFLVNVGAREGTAPRLAPGLYVLTISNAGGPNNNHLYPIQKFDALGTGPFASLNVAGVGYGTHSQQLYFRGIIGYNGYVFGWGFDSADTVNGDGPCRAMFCNLGNPLAWGNDNGPNAGKSPPVDRTFTDSDAIVMGTAGEIIRGAIVIYGKLFFGTNRGLHFLQGYGRDSFIANGTIPVMKAYNVVGPNALIEGPDRLLYGVSDQGLWRYDGQAVPDPLFARLVDYTGRSNGWWDLIWTDQSQASPFPGTTNQDLVWTAVDWARQQVLVGIPYCNAAAGSGAGNDTVIIKYHPKTGGFTRQVFRGVNYTVAAYFRRENQEAETHYLGTVSPGVAAVRRFGYQVSPQEAPVMPQRLPSTAMGPYAPFGPDGEGVVRRYYLTLAWDGPAALPNVQQVTTTIDQVVIDQFTLSVQPTAPIGASVGDYWLDTSESDQSIGNSGVSAMVPARGGFLLKTWGSDGVWRTIAGQGGTQGRATIQIPATRVVGTRVTAAFTTLVAAGRFEIEGFGLAPGGGEAAA